MTESTQMNPEIESTEINNPILEVRDTTVTFGMGHGESKVLNDINIDIDKGEILGVVGESGSGKSMFASSLLDAIVKPGVVDGEITYHRDSGPVDILSLPDDELRALRWEEISFVFQGAMGSFNPTMKVKEHFIETIEAHNADVKEQMVHARELLTDLYLDPDRVLNSYPHELSGGMKQRVLIALSLVLDPEVLVMDEPTAALDLLMQRSILSLLENIRDKYDLTIVFITHDLPLVASLADRIAVMYAFEFIEIGPARDVITDPAHPYTRALLRAVPSLDVPLSTMSPIEGSSPDPVDNIDACPYAPRCPLSTKVCRQEHPPFFTADRGHETACFHWETAREEIQMTSNADGEDAILDTVSAGSSDPVISLNNVAVHFEEKSGGLLNMFSDPDHVHAADDINIDIYENDVIALVGESGCGKSTLGKTSIGVQRPTTGSVKYHGQDIWETRDRGDGDNAHTYDEIRKALQIIPQDPGGSLNPNRTVEASLHQPLKQVAPELTDPDRHERILSMLEYVGMTPATDYASRYPHQLSGGEKQRVALIRALLMNPDMILADEAISALDVSLRVGMMDLMLDLQEHFNTSYLFISHDFSNARYLAAKSGGRIGVMYLGEIVEIGPAEEIINNPQHPYTKLLVWASSDMEVDESVEDPPVRGIDVPDPVDPPSGCRFHTRCPKARTVCTQENPQGAASEGEHEIACFRACDRSHPYWDSEPLDGTDQSKSIVDTADETDSDEAVSD